MSHLHHALPSPIALLRPNHVHLSATARLPHPPGPFEPSRLPPTQPCQSERNRSCPTLYQAFSGPIVRLRPNRIHSSVTTHHPHPPGPFEPGRFTSHPTVSIRAQSLISCLHHVVSSPTTRLPPPPCQFKRNRSSPVSTMSFQARPLVSHPHHVNLSATVRVPPPPCQFEPDCLCPTPTMSV